MFDREEYFAVPFIQRKNNIDLRYVYKISRKCKTVKGLLAFSTYNSSEHLSIAH